MRIAFSRLSKKEGKRRGIDENRSCTAPADTPDVRESGNRGADYKSLKILHTAEAPITQLELEKMQAVLYTFADKFLDKNKLAKVREVIK